MKTNPSYPSTRMRRLRKSAWLRDMLAEYHLSAADFILPVFVHEKAEQEEIKTLPDVKRLSVVDVVSKAKHAASLGIKAIAVFPVIAENLKTENAKESYNPQNLVNRTVQALKKEVPEIGVITDVALDPYTSHGQDGIVLDGDVANDETVAVLCKQAVEQARAGADIIAPSDMMDGRVGAIRTALDKAGFQNVAILSYAAKYASNFYGPFRDAVGSADNLQAGSMGQGKHTYQMDFRNSGEALREVELDVTEGADMVMVKPGMPYLDIIHKVASEFNVPVFAYQVSGEYAMLRFASQAGALDYQKTMLESLIAFKRAGATAILTYGAIEVAEWLNE